MNVPRLRFPEFQDAGEWDTKQLGELLLGHPDYGVNAAAVPYSEDLPAYLRITDISEEGYFLCGKKASVAIKATEENYLSEGDIVLARTGASVGKSYKFRKEDGQLVFAGFLIRIKPDPTKIDSTFLFNFLFTEQYWNWVRVTSARSGQPGINGNEYATLSIPIPPYAMELGGLSEQQKIADCLSSIDELIIAQTQKLSTLKAHKKGLMQQLFPAEGETLPKLRFPEFQDAGEWEEKRMEDVAPLQRGFDLPSDQIIQGSIPVVYSNGIQNFHNKRMAIAPGLVTGRSGTIGKIHFIEEGDYWPHNTSLWVTSFKGNFPKFIYYLYNTIGMNRFASGSGVPTLNRNYVHAFQVCLPPSVGEQQKIADCLSSIDELITTQTQKLDTLKTHKKALMQQLFPAMEEVSS